MNICTHVLSNSVCHSSIFATSDIFFWGGGALKSNLESLCLWLSRSFGDCSQYGHRQVIHLSSDAIQEFQLFLMVKLALYFVC